MLNNQVIRIFKTIRRKRYVFFRRLTAAKLLNLCKSVLRFLFRIESIRSYPSFYKIDVTPLCQLKCPVCIHTRGGGIHPQSFTNDMKMSLELFRRFVDEVHPFTIALSLFHMGEPLLNPGLLDMCEYANDKNINTYFTSNFSMKLSDDQIRRIVTSGVSALIVALDGFSQESYGRSRINGDVETVKKNLRRLMEQKRELNSRTPHVEIQSCLFDYSWDEKPLIEDFCRELGIDSVVIFQGQVGQWSVVHKPRKGGPKGKTLLPKCPWPYFASVVLYDGDIVPCCKYRLDELYALDVKRITMGTVREGTRFADVFNGSEYALARQMTISCTPETDGIRSNYCHECKWLYN